jgi:hypothetical protein
MITIGMLLSVNAWAQAPKSITETTVEVKPAVHISLNSTQSISDKEVKESREWTAARKHVDTQNITSYTGKESMELLAKVAN